MFKRLGAFVVLPREITDFERGYLARFNRIAIIFFWAHVPILMKVAALADTGPLMALGLGSFVLAGPTIAYFALANPRSVSLVYGFTAMAMGALLVHFGQGPVQIEMHFYFFALLAMLTVFGNPMVNLVAAVTVAAHHGLFWYYLPESVFNYEAPLWVVGVHALFVVLETVAAVFLARNFFDNVIGLEKIIEERTLALDQRNQEMRLVLDHVNQGLLTIDVEGTMHGEMSRKVLDYLGEPGDEKSFGAYVSKVDEAYAAWLEMALESIRDDFLPESVCLSQLPESLRVGERRYFVEYDPIRDAEGVLQRLLVVITDKTAEYLRLKREAEQRELMTLFQHVLQNKQGLLDFLREGQRLVDAIVGFDGEDLSALKRDIHTLKGSSGLFGMEQVGAICHEVEEGMEEALDAPSAAVLDTIAQAWHETQGRLSKFLQSDESARIELDSDEYHDVVNLLIKSQSCERVTHMVKSWRYEPTRQRLNLIAEQGRALAKRLGKTHVEFNTEPGRHRLDAQAWSSFWSAFGHAVRNAIDHGVEDTDTRAASGKDEKAHITVRTEVLDNEFVVELCDDGAGIDWPKLAQKAGVELGESPDADTLAEILFTEGVSSKDVATDISGRGVGMGAVRTEVESRGGSIEVDSTLGKGTTLRCRFDRAAMYPDATAKKAKAA